MSVAPAGSATRDHFGAAIGDLGDRYPKMMVLSCDLGSATRADRFRARHPDRYLECGISEANAISIAAGLAQEGFRPFVCSFGHFLTGKFLEIFQSVGLNDAPVVLVGTHAGMAIGKDGPTQMGLRDLALMRLLPNVRIFHPVDGAETRRVLEHLMSDASGPAYLRLCRAPTPELRERSDERDARPFRFGEPDLLLAGEDRLVIAIGRAVPEALAAARRLPAGRVGVANLSSLPLRDAAWAELIRGYRRVTVVEDHFAKGGIHDEILALMSRAGISRPVDHVAVGDYAQAGEPAELYRRYGMDADSLRARWNAAPAPA